MFTSIRARIVALCAAIVVAALMVNPGLNYFVTSNYNSDAFASTLTVVEDNHAAGIADWAAAHAHMVVSLQDAALLPDLVSALKQVAAAGSFIRAGEEGRGFAVAAGEVRSLAQPSAQGAREIRALIEATVASVKSGADQVSQAGETMSEVVTNVSNVTTVIAEVTHAADEQTRGIQEVNRAMSQLNELVHRTRRSLNNRQRPQQHCARRQTGSLILSGSSSSTDSRSTAWLVFPRTVDMPDAYKSTHREGRQTVQDARSALFVDRPALGGPLLANPVRIASRAVDRMVFRIF